MDLFIGRHRDKDKLGIMLQQWLLDSRELVLQQCSLNTSKIKSRSKIKIKKIKLKSPQWWRWLGRTWLLKALSEKMASIVVRKLKFSLPYSSHPGIHVISQKTWSKSGFGKTKEKRWKFLEDAHSP